ncbi:MAG: c-type cytochrome [Planctomycetota bacterium]
MATTRKLEPARGAAGDPLQLGRMIRVFAVLALVFLVSLAVAPAKSHFSEWREIQKRYNRHAAAAGLPPIDEKIEQIWNAELDIVDRCTSCHLAMGGAEPIAAVPLFRAHPMVAHDPARIGCTLCHGGQGRATRSADAHGEVEHWFEPILALEHLEAGCGSCHSGLPVGSPEVVARGARLFERHDCLACHRVEGRGGAQVAPLTFPDLSGIGVVGPSRGWHEDHLERLASNPDGPFRSRYGEIPPDEIAAIDEYMRTLVAAPRLAEGKRLFHTLGCRGCHKVAGVGGEDGPELTAIGKRPIEGYVFPPTWEGERSIPRWHVEHLLSPASVVPGSAMPGLALTREQARALTLYILSLREAEIPASYWPPDRLRVGRLGEHEFGTDGRSLTLVFCAACHGSDGLGRRYGELAQVFPGIATPAFLSVASDDFLRKTLMTGRPGRRMPAWGALEGGLRPEEIDAIIRYLRSLEPLPPGIAEVAAAAADSSLGERIYRSECATCHGSRGQGEIGPSLDSPVLHSLAGDRFLYEAIVDGRPGTAMPRHRTLDAGELASLIGHLRGLAGGRAATVNLGAVEIPPADPGRGEAAHEELCAPCHGASGEGGAAPAIGKRGFQRQAGNAFIVESYARARCKDRHGEAPPRVERGLLADIAAHLRASAARPGIRLEGRAGGGDAGAGRRIFCAGCHGAEAQGKEAPALANPAFLAAANDGYLQAMIVRGRHGTSMPRFDQDQAVFPRLSAGEINDVVSFIRSLEGGSHPERN